MKTKFKQLLTIICFASLMLWGISISAYAQSTLVWPVPGHTHLSRGFKIGATPEQTHDAIDIHDGSINGAPVVAAMSGTVHAIYLCNHNTYPNTPSCCWGFGTGLVIRGDDGHYYVYAHMQSGSVPPDVYYGSYVSIGKQIGRVGNTGCSTGPHLHFKITTSSQYFKTAGSVNPLNFQYTHNVATLTPVNFGNQFDAIIKNGPFNRVACVADNASSTWGYVTTAPYQDNSRFKWRFTRNSDGSYTITSHYNSCVLDVANAVFANGTTLQVIRPSGHVAQRWFIYKNDDGSYRIASAGNTNLVLTINNATYDLMLYGAQGTADQPFVPTAIPTHSHSHTWKRYKMDKATFTKDGRMYFKCSCGQTTTTKIYRITRASLAYYSKTYNGKTYRPAVTIKDSRGVRYVLGDDYTVSYSNNKSVGRAAVKITLKGRFSGTKTLYFNINPQRTTIKKLVAAKKGFKVYWKKQTSQTTGYQVRFSRSPKMKSAKIISAGHKYSSSKKISKLSAKKRYYVQIRTYKRVGRKNYYSSWSPVKSVVTK